MSESKLPRPDVATILAIERTHVAHERTMMAWIRTATSLITFGFVIYKYFEVMRADVPADQRIGPRELSLILISVGLFSLSVAVWQNRQAVLRMRALHAESPRSLAGLVAGVVAILGFMAFLSVILRL